MTLARQLQRLVPALSVRERFLVALREYKADQGITVNISDLTPVQREQYQEYARYCVAINNILGSHAELYERQAGFLNDHIERQIRILESSAAELEEELGIPREEMSWRRIRSKENLSVPAYLRGLAFQLRSQLVLEVDGLWQMVRAIETVWLEAEEELGEDPVHTSVREHAFRAKELLSAARSRLGIKKRPPEPTAELVEQAREIVRKSARLQVLQDP